MTPEEAVLLQRLGNVLLDNIMANFIPITLLYGTLVLSWSCQNSDLSRGFRNIRPPFLHLNDHYYVCVFVMPVSYTPPTQTH